MKIRLVLDNINESVDNLTPLSNIELSFFFNIFQKM